MDCKRKDLNYGDDLFLCLNFKFKIFLAEFLQPAPFDPTKKKKKKKVVIQDPAEEVEKLAEKTESLTGMDYFEYSASPLLGMFGLRRSC